jgi:hypothetical protein
MNYKEQLEQGQVWTRCYRVEFSNPFNGIPSVNMMEETIISIAGEIITLIPECTSVYQNSEAKDWASISWET